MYFTNFDVVHCHEFARDTNQSVFEIVLPYVSFTFVYNSVEGNFANLTTA